MKTSKGESNTVVYVGPTIKNVATRNTTYNNGVPDALNKLIRELPYLKNLVIPISELPEAVKQINKKQGPVYAFYAKALQEGV